MSTEKTIDISVLPEAEQDLIKALFDKCCERVNQKVAEAKPRIWKPKCGEWYWYISDNGILHRSVWHGDYVDEARYSIGNCFRTEEDAEYTLGKYKVKIELQRFADTHNDPDKLEWNKTNGHYEIVYNYRLGRLDFSELRSCSSTDAIYFTSEELAKKAVETVGRERILKYMFSIDCEEDD